MTWDVQTALFFLTCYACGVLMWYSFVERERSGGERMLKMWVIFCLLLLSYRLDEYQGKIGELEDQLSEMSLILERLTR